MPVMRSWVALAFVLALVLVGCYGIGTALRMSDPPSSIEQPDNATPVGLTSGEYWATTAARISPVPTAVPVLSGPQNLAYVANPCHTEFRYPRCPTEIAVSPYFGGH